MGAGISRILVLTLYYTRLHPCQLFWRVKNLITFLKREQDVEIFVVYSTPSTAFAVIKSIFHIN